MRFTFSRSQRLTHNLEYQSVYAAKVRKSSGPLIVTVKPNALGRHRLGLAVPRAAGNAPRRSRLKRLVREAFRLDQHDWPKLGDACYDVIVGFRAHQSGVKPVAKRGAKRVTAERSAESFEPTIDRAEEVRGLLRSLITLAHQEWTKRSRAKPTPPPPPDTAPRRGPERDT